VLVSAHRQYVGRKNLRTFQKNETFLTRRVFTSVTILVMTLTKTQDLDLLEEEI
jgi:hypothetical protein